MGTKTELLCPKVETWVWVRESLPVCLWWYQKWSTMKGLPELRLEVRGRLLSRVYLALVRIKGWQFQGQWLSGFSEARLEYRSPWRLKGPGAFLLRQGTDCGTMTWMVDSCVAPEVGIMFELPRDDSSQTLGFLWGMEEKSTIVITMLWISGVQGLQSPSPQVRMSSPGLYF